MNMRKTPKTWLELEARFEQIESVEDLVNIRSELTALPDTTKYIIRTYINSTSTTPYTAVASVLLDSAKPDYDQLLKQIKE